MSLSLRNVPVSSAGGGFTSDMLQTEPPKKKPKSLDKLRNSALRSLPAVLPTRTAEVRPGRAAGPISVGHRQGTVPHPGSCWGQQGSPSQGRGSALPGIVQTRWEMVWGRFTQGLGKPTKAAVWEAWLTAFSVSRVG